MANFFSAIQNKFKARYHGRYVGHLIEQIAEFHPQIVLPLLWAARNSDKDDSNFRPTKRKLLDSIESVTTEVVFLNRKNDDEDDRRADMEILLNIDDKPARVLVEIKMLDSFLKGQLKNYKDWSEQHNEVDGSRRVVVLTAYPLTREEMNLIEGSKKVCHIYLSDLVDELEVMSQSELVTLFKNYMYEEGYAMYKLEKGSVDDEAFKSFMVLNFLPHLSGKGKVVAAKKISRGPIVFSSLVQNWQLVSDRLSAVLPFSFNQKPTIRYFPEQCGNEANGMLLEKKDGILHKRRKVRAVKKGGRYWLMADQVIPGRNNLRIEWGQVIQISLTEDDITCELYALVHRKNKEFSHESFRLKSGVVDPLLYTPEKLLGTLKVLVERVIAGADKEIQTVGQDEEQASDGASNDD